MKRFVLGDIHGEYEYLLDVLKKSNFDYENDLLIQIGDLVDRGPEPFKCIDELLKIKNKVLIVGNHDAALVQYAAEGIDFLGGRNGTGITIYQWNKFAPIQQATYLTEFFAKQRLFHITDDNIMFVHGGFLRDEKLTDVEDRTFYWDRELFKEAMTCEPGEVLETLYNFKHIYVGHTPTLYWGEIEPITKGGITNIDTGSGKGGPLTIMDIDTKEYWQSDYSMKLQTYGFAKKNSKIVTQTQKAEADKGNSEGSEKDHSRKKES